MMGLILGANQSLFAQLKDSTNSNEKVKDSYFKPKLSFLSNDVYNGRKDDSLTISYLSPSFEYYDQSGFNFYTGISYLTSTSQHRIDLFDFGAGYNFKINKQWEVELNAEKDFYNDSSRAAQGSTKGFFNMESTYDFDVLQLGGGTEILFAEATQYNANISLAHSFTFGEEDTSFWTITPTAKALYGTQNFIDNVSKKKVKRKIKNTYANYNAVIDIQGGSNSFSVLDYEISLPITYESTKWGITFTPTYYMPVNANTTIIKTTLYKLNGTILPTAQQPPLTIEKEKLSNNFYFDLEVFWKFNAKKQAPVKADVK